MLVIIFFLFSWYNLLNGIILYFRIKIQKERSVLFQYIDKIEIILARTFFSLLKTALLMLVLTLNKIRTLDIDLVEQTLLNSTQSSYNFWMNSIPKRSLSCLIFKIVMYSWILQKEKTQIHCNVGMLF